MKTLMFSLTFVVALVLYGAGFFVPETRGIENTVDGHVVLNDAEMSQLVGGPTRWKMELVEPEGFWQESPLSCGLYAVEDCSSSIRRTVEYPKHKCVDCGSDISSIQYVWQEKEPANIEYYCKNRYTWCETMNRVVNYHHDVCPNQLATNCMFYPPQTVNYGNSW